MPSSTAHSSGADPRGSVSTVVAVGEPGKPPMLASKQSDDDRAGGGFRAMRADMEAFARSSRGELRSPRAASVEYGATMADAKIQGNAAAGQDVGKASKDGQHVHPKMNMRTDVVRGAVSRMVMESDLPGAQVTVAARPVLHNVDLNEFAANSFDRGPDAESKSKGKMHKGPRARSRSPPRELRTVDLGANMAEAQIHQSPRKPGQPTRSPLSPAQKHGSTGKQGDRDRSPGGEVFYGPGFTTPDDTPVSDKNTMKQLLSSTSAPVLIKEIKSGLGEHVVKARPAPPDVSTSMEWRGNARMYLEGQDREIAPLGAGLAQTYGGPGSNLFVEKTKPKHGKSHGLSATQPRHKGKAGKGAASAGDLTLPPIPTLDGGPKAEKLSDPARAEISLPPAKGGETTKKSTFRTPEQWAAQLG